MSTDGEERTTVKTYVPATQREQWDEHAEDLDMSRSEFVRTMVQAGRRGFGGPTVAEEAEEKAEDGEEPDPQGANPGGHALETVVLDVLREQPREFDDVVDAVADDIRTEVNEVLSELREQGRVTHEPLNGGFRVTEDG